MDCGIDRAHKLKNRNILDNTTYPSSAPSTTSYSYLALQVPVQELHNSMVRPPEEGGQK